MKRPEWTKSAKRKAAEKRAKIITDVRAAARRRHEKELRRLANGQK